MLAPPSPLAIDATWQALKKRDELTIAHTKSRARKLPFMQLPPPPVEVLKESSIPQWVHTMWSELKTAEWGACQRRVRAAPQVDDEPRRSKRSRWSVEDVSAALQNWDLNSKAVSAPAAPNPCTTLAVWAPPMQHNPPPARLRRHAAAASRRSRARVSAADDSQISQAPLSSIDLAALERLFRDVRAA